MTSFGPSLLRAIGPEDDLALPPGKVIAMTGLLVSGGLGAVFVDFCMKRSQQNKKRKRVFSKTVRAYLQEFNNELAIEQTKALSQSPHHNALKDRLPSTEGELLPFCLTHSFRMSQADVVEATHFEYKTIHLSYPQGENRKLVVRRGATEEHVRHGILRVLKLPTTASFVVTRDGHPTAISHEMLIDGGIYNVMQVINPRLRRQSMIVKATEAGAFRYSVGIDWKEVSNMLRKAIDYGEDESIINQLHLLLAMHLIERLASFADESDNEMYSIGKAVDEIDRDLKYLASMLRVSKESALSPCKSQPGNSRSAKELVSYLERHLKEHNKSGLDNLFELLRRSFLRKEHLISNSLSFCFSSAAGLMQPCVSALQIRFASEVSTASTTDDLVQVRNVLFWTISYTIILNLLTQASKSMHAQQTAATVQVLRKKAAHLMSRADQAFLDTHEVEDILATLEGDIGNIGLLLRYGRGWLIDISRILGSAKRMFSTLNDDSGVGLVVGATAGVVLMNGLVWAKSVMSRQLDHIPEEEDDVQEFLPGTKVRYHGKDMTVKGLRFECGDEGCVIAVGPVFITCKFAVGVVDLHEKAIEPLEHTGQGTVVGGPALDFDEVWDEETFTVARMWGKDVEEVDAALGTKDLQIKKQCEFVFIPGVLSDVVDTFHENAPKLIMLMVAIGFFRLFNNTAVQSVGSKLMVLESEAAMAMTCGKRIHAEMKALIHDSFVGARRTVYLLDYRPTIDVDSEEKLRPAASDVEGRIEFRNVRFAYPTTPSKHILRDLSFVIEPGTHVALVGASGCGKSTIYTLLSRLYDPQQGEILLDGKSIKEYDVKHLRRHLINTAVQDPYIFDGSLQYNVKYAKPDAPRGQVMNALATACLEKVVKNLPEGLLTVMGGGGVRFSGGEQKRIGLARTLLGMSKVLLLDEPTAGLDATTEAEVREKLKKYRQSTGSTMVTISHNLSFIQDCDHILVLGNPDGSQHGTIIAQGKHDELIKNCREYNAFARTQQVRSNPSSDISPSEIENVPYASNTDSESMPSPM